MVHFFSVTGRGIYGNFSAMPMGHKLVGIARRGVLKELEVCDFDTIWSACQRDDGSCCEKFSEFLMVTFSYNQTKR